MPKWELEGALGEVEGFERADVRIEKYITGMDVPAVKVFMMEGQLRGCESCYRQ